MNFKVVVSDPKTRKAYQKEIEQAASGLLGKKTGDKVSGNPLDLTGYELQITGGSDKDGFPMRPDVAGAARKRVLLSFPPGFHPKRKGQRRRRSVCGNTISQDIVQVNMKVVGYGQQPIERLLGLAKEDKSTDGGIGTETKRKAGSDKEETKPKTGEKKPAEKPAEKPKEKAGAKEPEKREEPEKEEKPAEKPEPEKEPAEKEALIAPV